ncbi:LamG-like jellyroll fold domain-containing protein [Arthrobacter rhombi]|uniref:LamG-like jellyroll fold domain-containing protein n=1 Tax=Arthrobacter rhombi TaxID=71253 RepID=UPI003FD1B21D
MPYTFDAIQAFDPTDPKRVASDAEVTFFAPDDPNQTPIEITDVTGLALPNPYLTNDLGSIPQFMANMERVAWASGEMGDFLTSWEGLRDAAEASRVAAEEAASEAVGAVAEQLGGYTESVEASKAAAETAASAAAASAGLVDAPAGEAVRAAIGPDGAAEGTLRATIGEAIAAALGMYIPKPPAIDAWAHWGDSLTAASTSGDWVTRFASQTGMPSHNGGVGGESASQIMARMTAPEADQYRDRMLTLSAGRNGFKGTSSESIVADIGRMVSHLSVGFKGFIFDVPPWETEVPGDPNRAKLDTLNTMIHDTFPGVYLPVFASLRTQAAADAAGITFTAQDDEDIANGVTPGSFRIDGGHLNAAGGLAVSDYLLKAARERGFVPELQLHSLGVDGYADRFYPAALDPDLGAIVPLVANYGSVGKPLTNTAPAESAVKVANTVGIGKHLRSETVFSAGGRLQRDTAMVDDFTFVAVVRSLAWGADFVMLGPYAFRRAGNGQWQLQGAGNSLATGSDDWVLVVGVCSGTSSVFSINGVESGAGTITGPATSGDFEAFGANVTVSSSKPVEMAEFAVWDRVLNSSERSQVVAAMRAKYPALPQA